MPRLLDVATGGSRRLESHEGRIQNIRLSVYQCRIATHVRQWRLSTGQASKLFLSREISRSVSPSRLETRLDLGRRRHLMHSISNTGVQNNDSGCKKFRRVEKRVLGVDQHNPICSNKVALRTWATGLPLTCCTYLSPIRSFIQGFLAAETRPFI